MADYQDTVKQIENMLACMAQNVPTDLQALTALVAEYQHHVEVAIRRLDECGEYLAAGQRAQALHLAETHPPLLDVIAALDFSGLQAWRALLARNNLPPPPVFNLTKIQFLDAAYGEHEALEPLQKIYRRLVLCQGGTPDKIALLRRLKLLDPNNPT